MVEIICRETLPCTESQPIAGPDTETDNHSLIFTPTGNLESSINLILFCMSLGCGRKPENHAYTGTTCKLHADRPWLV